MINRYTTMNAKKAKRLRKAMNGLGLPEQKHADAKQNKAIGLTLRKEREPAMLPVLVNHVRRIKRELVRTGKPFRDIVVGYYDRLRKAQTPAEHNKKGRFKKMAKAKQEASI